MRLYLRKLLEGLGTSNLVRRRRGIGVGKELGELGEKSANVAGYDWCRASGETRISLHKTPTQAISTPRLYSVLF